MKNNKGNKIMFLGLMLIISALFLTFYNIYDENRAIKTAGQILSEVSVIISDRHENVEDRPAVDYMINPGMEMPVSTIDGWDYVGRISIPSLGIDLPVINECNSYALKIAACRYHGSAYKDDMVISAHNYKGFFRELKNITTGATAVFTDMNGNEFEYGMFYVEELRTTQVDEMINGDWDLTLFTCTPGGAYRIAVRFLRVSGYGY